MGSGPSTALTDRFGPRVPVAFPELAAIAAAIAPLKGRWLKPRSMEVGSGQPVKVLTRNYNRLGAYIFNNGATLELPVPLPQAGAGIGIALARFIDSGGVSGPPGFKTAYLQVSTQLAWVTAGQPTIQTVLGRQPWPALSGAGSGVGPPAANAAKGITANLGPGAATTLAVGIWPFSPVDLPELQWPHPFIGFELVFPSALTAGAASLYIEQTAGAAMFVGEDPNITQSIGERGGSFPIPAQSAPLFMADDGEVWAIASQGTVDCRIWEIVRETPDPERR